MRRCEVSALCLTVMQTWNDGLLDESIRNVFKRLRKVLVLIVEGGGSNKLVKIKRGKKHDALTLPPTAPAAPDVAD